MIDDPLDVDDGDDMRPPLSLDRLRSVPWWAVIRKTAAEVIDDRCFGLAAQMAFYFLLALFPALLFLVALIGYLPIDSVFDELLATLGAVAPREFVLLVGGQIDQLVADGQPGLVTLGICGALWSSSAAMVAIIEALNHAYDVGESRPWWRRRLVALGLTLALAAFIAVSLTVSLIGPETARRLASWAGVSSSVVVLWSLLRWPAMILQGMVAINLIYYLAPNRRTHWAWMTPGAIVATTLWIVSWIAFKFYVVNFGNYAATYGAIGGIIVTMLWFYLSSVAILVGAELNAVLEQTGAATAAEGESPWSRGVATRS